MSKKLALSKGKQEHMNHCLSLCIIMNKFSEAKQYLEKGADINYVDGTGTNLIYRYWQHIDTVKFLVENGINVNHLNNLGRSLPNTVLNATALAYRLEKDEEYKEYEAMLKYLIKSGAEIHQKQIEKNHASASIKNYLEKLCLELKQEQAAGGLEVLNEVFEGKTNDLYLSRLPTELLGMIDEAMGNYFIIGD